MAAAPQHGLGLISLFVRDRPAKTIRNAATVSSAIDLAMTRLRFLFAGFQVSDNLDTPVPFQFVLVSGWNAVPPRWRPYFPSMTGPRKPQVLAVS